MMLTMHTRKVNEGEDLVDEQRNAAEEQRLAGVWYDAGESEVDLVGRKFECVVRC